MLKLSQLGLSVLRPGEDDAVVKSVGLTLPELNQVRLHDVTAPVINGQLKTLRKDENAYRRVNTNICQILFSWPGADTSWRIH